MARGSRYTDAYKREAVAKAEASGSVSQTARELGISDKTLHTWKTKFGAAKDVSAETSTSAELAARVAQLERQVAIRDQQISVLKKAISIVSQHGKNDLP
jgi:transposase-like protein